MYVQSIAHSKGFQVIDQEEIAAEVSYKTTLSEDAHIQLAAQSFTISPSDRWDSRYLIIKEQLNSGEIVFNWQGNSIIRVQNGLFPEIKFIIKKDVFQKLQFLLIDEEEDSVIKIKPTSNWSEQNYGYAIEVLASDYKEEQIIELLCFALYAINLIMVKQNGNGYY